MIGLGVEPELGHQSTLDVLVLHIAAEPELRELELAVPEHLARVDKGAILRIAEARVGHVVDAQLQRLLP